MRPTVRASLGVPSVVDRLIRWEAYPNLWP